jgi:hypothetical protein
MRQIWWLAFCGFFALSATFALSTPRSLGPDEPAQIVRAAGAARLEASNYRNPNALSGPAYLTPEVLPADYAFYGDLTQLLYGHPSTTHCVPTSTTCEVTTATYEGAYTPVYYMLVGWPSLLISYKHGIYAMRLLSALLSALLLASAVRTAAESRARRYGVVGVLAAATPAAIFLDGVVNPNGAEVSAAILTWVTALALALDPDPALTRRRLLRLCVGGGLLLTLRTLGPLWVCGIALAAAFAASAKPWQGLGERLRRVRRRPSRELLVVSGFFAVVGLFTVGWDLYAGATSVDTSGQTTPGLVQIVKQFGGATWLYIKQEFGQYGWGETRDSAKVIALGLLVILALFLVALRYAERRHAVLLCAMLLAGAFIAIPLNTVIYGTMMWMGRYQLPFTVGLPVLAGLLAGLRAPRRSGSTEAGASSPRSALFGRVSEYLPMVLVGLLTIEMVGFFRAVSHRYFSGDWTPIALVTPRWNPPYVHWKGSWLLLGAGLVLVAAAALLAQRRGARDDGPQQEVPPGSVVRSRGRLEPAPTNL